MGNPWIVPWEGHRRFILVSHNPSFFKKISFGLAALEGVVAQLNGVRELSAVPLPAVPKPRRKGGKNPAARR